MPPSSRTVYKEMISFLKMFLGFGKFDKYSTLPIWQRKFPHRNSQISMKLFLYGGIFDDDGDVKKCKIWAWKQTTDENPPFLYFCLRICDFAYIFDKRICPFLTQNTSKRQLKLPCSRFLICTFWLHRHQKLHVGIFVDLWTSFTRSRDNKNMQI